MKLLPTLLAACLFATVAHGQGVEVAPLTAPDVFSGGARDTGLGSDLWKGASAELARRVMPTLGTKPLSPAARALAVRVLSTGANAPDGAGEDRVLAAARGLVTINSTVGIKAVAMGCPVKEKDGVCRMSAAKASASTGVPM